MRAEAAVGPDGIPRISLRQEPAGFNDLRVSASSLGAQGAARASLAEAVEVAATSQASQLVHGSGSSREAEAAMLMQAALEHAQAESARLRSENAGLRTTQELLRREAGMLRRESDQLREETFVLRRDDSELRKEDAELRAQDWRLRSRTEGAAMPSLSVLESRVRDKHGKIMAIVGVSIGVFVVAFLACCFNCLYDDSMEDMEDEDILQEQEKNMRNALGLKGGEHRSCWTRCCGPGPLLFLLFLTLFTGVGGYIMWTLGLLQPILAQFSIYLYGIIILGAFIVLLLAEMWWTLKSFFVFFALQLTRMKTNVKGTVSKSAYVIRDFLDDGRLNRSVPGEPQ